jgi:hypothetical protein
MKIFDKNYVGVKHDRTDTSGQPLAFLTPYETNAAGIKRQDSVDQWVRGSYYASGKTLEEEIDVRIIDNVPSAGFCIVDSVSRDMTSNKFARVADPNGYELEISIANLIGIMLVSTVEKGVIQGECVWGRDGANNHLLLVGSEVETQALREGQVLTAKIGDSVIGNFNREYIYLGQGYVQNISAAGPELPSLDGTRNWWGASRHNHSRIDAQHIATSKKHGRYGHVYLTVSNNVYKNNHLTVRKDPMKLTRILASTLLQTMDNTVYTAPGIYCSADGEFSHEPDCNSSFQYYTTHALFRKEPFTNDDLDFNTLHPQFKKK